MSVRTVWQIHLLVFGVMLLGTFISGMFAAVTQSARVGSVTGVFGATAFFLGSGFIAYIESDLSRRANPRMSRQARRRMRDEQERIRVDAEIRRMEREAGL